MDLGNECSDLGVVGFDGIEPLLKHAGGVVVVVVGWLWHVPVLFPVFALTWTL